MFGNFALCHASVSRSEEPAVGTPAVASPCVDLELPHPGEQDAWIARIHNDVGAAGFFVNEQNLCPVPSAVRRAKHTAIRLRSISVPERAYQHDVGILWIDRNAR